MKGEGEIRVEEVLTCLLCQRTGRELYSGLADRLFGAPGKWGFLQCTQCGLVWLNPRPVPQDIGRVYKTYYTHEYMEEKGSPSIREKAKLGLFSAARGYEGLATGWAWRLMGKTLSLIPTVNEVASMGTMYLDGQNKGRMLEWGVAVADSFPGCAKAAGKYKASIWIPSPQSWRRNDSHSPYLSARSARPISPNDFLRPSCSVT